MSETDKRKQSLYFPEAMLKEMGKSVELVVYPDAGHAFFNDTRPEAYNADASDDAWQRTLEWYDRYLRKA